MKKFIFLTLTLLLSVSGYSQEWALMAEYSGVIVEYRYEDQKRPDQGTDKKYLLIRVKNTNEYSVRFSFFKELYYNNTCLNCETHSEEYRSTLVLQAGQVEQGNINDPTKKLKVFVQMNDKASNKVLTQLEIKDVTVSRMD